MLYNRNLHLFVWATFIMILMGVPGEYFPKTHSILLLFSPDKIVHFFLFGILCIFIFNVLEKYFPHKKLSFLAMLSIIFGLIYGSLTEILQKFVFIGRDGNYIDLLADSIGLCLGLWIYLFFSTKKKKGNKPKEINNKY
jgi:VanZ family protein